MKNDIDDSPMMVDTIRLDEIMGYSGCSFHQVGDYCWTLIDSIGTVLYSHETREGILDWVSKNKETIKAVQQGVAEAMFKSDAAGVYLV